MFRLLYIPVILPYHREPTTTVLCTHVYICLDYCIQLSQSGQTTVHNRGGGLVLYVGSKFLNHSSQINSCSTITKNLEQLWILLDKPNVRKIVVCILYRPLSGDADTAIKELSNSIEYVQSLCDAELVVMGDMNVNYRDRHSKSFDKIKEFERVFNLTQLISEPTRVTLKSTSTIDLTNTLYIAEHGVLDTILTL